MSEKALLIRYAKYLLITMHCSTILYPCPSGQAGTTWNSPLAIEYCREKISTFFIITS